MNKYELSRQEQMDGIFPEPHTKAFVVQMLLIYSDAAVMQYEEAERLMCVAIAAKEHADALMDRCADLIAENIGPDWERKVVTDGEEDVYFW